MRLKKFQQLAAAVFLGAIISTGTMAGPLPSPLPYETSRTLGMGGACVAIADDQQALFSNPAGLALQKQSKYSVINVSGEQNDQHHKVTNSIDSLSDADTAAARTSNFKNLMDIMGEKGSQAWSAMSYYIGATGFGIAALYQHSEYFAVENPANPRVYANIYQDAMLSGSIAREFGETQVLFKDRALGWWGATMKMASRKTGEHVYHARDFAALTPQILKDTDRTGFALDFDLGALWQLNNAWNTSIGLFAGNILNSDYSEEAGTMKRQFAIGTSIKPLTGPPERNEKLVLAADYWETGEDRSALCNLRLGMQLRVSKYIHLLAGLRGGYPTAGFAVSWHDLRVHAATYGEELGNRPGEREDRRTSVTFNLEF